MPRPLFVAAWFHVKLSGLVGADIENAGFSEDDPTLSYGFPFSVSGGRFQ